MALIVETGDIVEGADSYVTLAEYQAYMIAFGWLVEKADQLDEIHLRRAFAAINRVWTYKGCAVSSDQVGAFPRDMFTGIPQRVKDAQCEMAYLVRQGADPFATIEATVSREKIGPMEVEYQGGLSSPRYRAVTNLLRDYLRAGESNTRIMRA